MWITRPPATTRSVLCAPLAQQGYPRDGRVNRRGTAATGSTKRVAPWTGSRLTSACAERVEGTIEIDDLLAPPCGHALAEARSSLSERRLVRALATAGLPIVTGLAVPTRRRHSDPVCQNYWPDAALRDRTALLLVDIECDGTGHHGT